MLKEGKIVSSVVTEALRRELVLRELGQKADRLRKAETSANFPEVTELYRVIDSDTRTVVVDPELVERLKKGERVIWQELMRGSVQIWARKVQDLRLRPFDRHEELYYWTTAYDPDFLGYLAGVLPLIHGRDTGLFA
jgi:hypothetical protein